MTDWSGYAMTSEEQLRAIAKADNGPAITAACRHGADALALLRAWANRGAPHREAQAQWDAAVAALLAEADRG